MKKIIVTGSAAFDYIMNFPGVFEDSIDASKLHVLSVSFLAETLKKEKGGVAGNLSYNLSLLDSPALILATVGEDFDNYAKFLKDAGVDLSGLKVIDGESSSIAMILTDKKNNQITAFHPGAMNEADGLTVKGIEAGFCIVGPTKPEAMAKTVSECRELSIPYMYDPGMQLPRLSDEDLTRGIEGAEILIANDYEMGIIESRVMNKISLKPKILITTLGGEGSMINFEDKGIRVNAAKPTEVLDPTGAGDAYRAGFLAGYLRDFDLKICGQMGSVASCYAVEKYGTTNHKFTDREFEERYFENFGETITLG